MKMAFVWVVASLIALMMEAASTSKTSLNVYQIPRGNNPEDSHLQENMCFKHTFFNPTNQKKKSYLLPLR
jgi:hypothetical protein